MTPEQFCYWLQGFNEVRDESKPPTESEWLIICDHLQTVFKKETPYRSSHFKIGCNFDEVHPTPVLSANDFFLTGEDPNDIFLDPTNYVERTC